MELVTILEMIITVFRVLALPFGNTTTSRSPTYKLACQEKNDLNLLFNAPKPQKSWLHKN